MRANQNNMMDFDTAEAKEGEYGSPPPNQPVVISPMIKSHVKPGQRKQDSLPISPIPGDRNQNSVLTSPALSLQTPVGHKLDKILKGNLELGKALLSRDQKIEENNVAMIKLLNIIDETETDIKGLLNCVEVQNRTKQTQLQLLEQVRIQMEQLLQRNKQRKDVRMRKSKASKACLKDS